MNPDTNFEEWAKLLITRKVPQDFTHLIGPEVIHSGADILKRGESFEVHLSTGPAGAPEYSSCAQGCVFVTPMPHVCRAPHYYRVSTN